MLDMDKADMVGSARKDHNSSNDIAERDLEKCEMYDNVTAPRIKLQKVSSFRSVVLEALRNEKIQNLRVVVKEDMKATFETFMCDFKQFMYQAFAIQTEELKKHWLKMQVCSEGSQLRIPDSGLQLQFRYDPPHDVYTGEKLEGGHFVLICRFTGEIVNSGPLSNAEVQIVVIQGGFGKKNNKWTSKDFEDNVVTERDDKAPLLTGDLIVTLKEGIGNLGELSFTDNSSWVKSKKFRLGVKVVTKSCDGITIKEGITEAFTVKESRGMVYKKHEIPSPNDEVWRLKKIRQNSLLHKQLQGIGIKTVSDFLERYEQDGQKLRIELGIKPKAWDAILKHAKKCVSVDISSQPVDSPHGAVQPLSTDQPAELPQETLQRPSVPPLDKTLLGNAIPDTSSPNVASAASEHHDPGSLMYTEGTSVIQEKFEGASTFSQCFEAYGPRPSDDYAHRQLVSATNGRQLPMQQEVVCSQDVGLSQGIAVPMLNTIPDCIGRESNCQNGQANHFLDGTIEENQITQSNVVSNSRCGTQIEPPSHTSIQNHLPSSAFFGSHDQRVPLTCDNVSTVFQERFHEPPPPTDHEEGYAAQGPTTYEDLFGVEDMIWFEEDMMMIMNYVQGGDHSSQQELDPLPPGAGYNIGGKNAVYWATKVFLFLRKLSRPKKRRRIQF